MLGVWKRRLCRSAVCTRWVKELFSALPVLFRFSRASAEAASSCLALRQGSAWRQQPLLRSAGSAYVCLARGRLTTFSPWQFISFLSPLVLVVLARVLMDAGREDTRDGCLGEPLCPAPAAVRGLAHEPLALAGGVQAELCSCSCWGLRPAGDGAQWPLCSLLAASLALALNGVFTNALKLVVGR